MRSDLQRWLQYFTSSKLFFRFLRMVKGFLQTAHSLASLYWPRSSIFIMLPVLWYIVLSLGFLKLLYVLLIKKFQPFMILHLWSVYNFSKTLPRILFPTSSVSWFALYLSLQGTYFSSLGRILFSRTDTSDAGFYAHQYELRIFFLGLAYQYVLVLFSWFCCWTSRYSTK